MVWQYLGSGGGRFQRIGRRRSSCDWSSPSGRCVGIRRVESLHWSFGGEVGLAHTRNVTAGCSISVQNYLGASRLEPRMKRSSAGTPSTVAYFQPEDSYISGVSRAELVPRS